MSGMQKQHQKHEGKASVTTKKVEQKTSQHLNAMQMMESPETLRSEDVLAAQQQVGNQVVQRTLVKGKQDAAATDEQGNLRSELASKIQQKRGGGEALPEGVRKEAQKVLGKDFNNVRIHTDSTSDTLSRSVSARAFTIGSDIFFKSGVFAPGTSKGRETIMHELTHVVQQAGSSKSAGGKLKLGAPDTAMEKEADHIGKTHAQVKLGAAAGASGVVQKESVEDEELLQGAPEEEEELQMQHDTSPVIQRVEDEELLQGAPEEEDELQMQPDVGNVVQRVEEEELIQGAPEEEELQMQPDAGNVVQRDDDDVFVKGKLDYKKYSKQVLGNHRVSPGISKQVEMFGGSKLDKVTTNSVMKPPNKPLPEIPQKKHTPPNKPLPEIPQKKHTPPNKPLPEIPQKKHTPPNKPLPEIPGSIPQAPDLPKTKGATSDVSLSFADQIKAKSKSMRSNSQRENLAKLEQDRAQKTGERLTEQYKEDQENKPKPAPKPISKWGKVKGFFKKAGSTALDYTKKAGSAAWKYGKIGAKAGLSKLGGMLKDQVGEAKKQFVGEGEKKEEKAAPATSASPVTVNVGGGGGGGGGGGMAETISDLFQENKRLKAQVAELEKEKEKV